MSATPLLLLHGFPLDSRMWDDVSDLLADDGVANLRLDAPGFGIAPVIDAEPSLDLVADGIVASLDALGIDRVVLAGLSMGGYIALAVVARHASRVAGLALLDTKASADTEAARVNRLRIASLADDGDTSAREAVGPMISTLLGASTLRTRPDVVARHRDWLTEAPAAGVAWCQRAMAARPARLEVLEDLSVPGLVLRGAEDELCTQDDAETMVRAMAEHDGDAELVVVPGAGHMSATEAPEAVAGTLAGFWRHCVG